MNGLKYYERTSLLIELIEKRKTGPPGSLAKKLGVTERTVYNILESLRLFFPRDIVYSSEDKSYVFMEKNNDD